MEGSYEGTNGYRYGKNHRRRGCTGKVCRICGFKPIKTLSGGEKGRVALTALMLRKDNLRHGVEVSIQNDKLVIELHIIVAYEVSILAVAENLVDNVKYKVEEFTGMEVGKIVVCVEGVRVIN